jgi:class 3 adenylate cyclase
MDRITYISKFREGLTVSDIKEIGRKSEANNEKDGLTGVLMCFKGVFYQILEGPPKTLYKCFNRIKTDPRHEDIFILDIKRNINQRLYGEWKMRTVFLDENKDPLISPIRDLLASLTNTHTTLKKYAPFEVLDGIQAGQDPLKWRMRRTEMVVLFTDLIGFSTLVEKASINDVQKVLDNYFRISLSIINSTGGTISKLMGDGFMAYYPTDREADALHASVEIVNRLKKTRLAAKSHFIKLSYCSIGISAGAVVQGNVGSLVKMDYTILGDVVNSASRLESYTRKKQHAVIFDHRFKKYLPKDLSLDIMEIGALKPKGKTQTLKIFTVANPDVRFDKSPSQIAERIRSVPAEH